jgi:hypothetical protein
MYGENSGLLRDALGELLRQHRIQQRLGGAGIHTVPETTTVEEREELGKQIRRYRHCVLTWSLQAVRAANPRISIEGTSGRTRGPSEELRHRLTEALNASTAGLAPGEELATEQTFATVESWRQAARAAALGEHDFGAGVGYGRLSKDQCMTVLKDGADVVRGLVALDRRYEGMPGWEKLTDQSRLGRAAEVCAVYAGYDEPDYTVDVRGWQPKAAPMNGPALPGFAGVLQAQYYLLIHLDQFPDARSLRVVMDSQRIVAREAAIRIGDAAPELAHRWRTRSETYDRLVKETRDLGGILGKGGLAAGQGAVAATRVQKLDASDLTDTKVLRQLDRLFARIDGRVYDAVEHGVKERLYFIRVAVPRVDDLSGDMVKPRRVRYVPIVSPAQRDLIAIVRRELRLEPTRPQAPKGAGQSRADFEAAIAHRPGDPGPAMSI